MTNRLSHEHGLFDPSTILLMHTSCNISYEYNFSLFLETMLRLSNCAEGEPGLKQTNSVIKECMRGFMLGRKRSRYFIVEISISSEFKNK